VRGPGFREPSSGARRPRRPSPTIAGVVTGLTLAASAACGGAGNPTVVRRIEGESTEGRLISPHVYEHFLRGELAYAAEDWAVAAEAFRQARAAADEDPLVLARLAESLDRLDRRDEAATVLSTGASLFPGHPALAMARGRIAERGARWDEAVAAFREAADGRDPDGSALLALARVLEASGRPGRAEAVLAARLREPDGRGLPAAGDARVARARLALALRRGDPGEAARAIDDLIAVAPARAEEVRAVAESALDAGDPALAARLLDRIPLTAEDIPLRLEALVRAGRLEEAEALLEHPALPLPADDPRRAAWSLRVGRPDLAVELVDAHLARRGNGADDETGAADPDGPLQRLRGRAWIALGELGRGALTVASAPPSAGDYVTSRLALARALRWAGHDALAAETLAAAHRARPDEPRVAAALARALEAAGAWDAAAQVWMGIAAPTPEDERRVAAARRLRDDEPGEAARLLRTHVTDAPEDLGAWVWLAEAARAAGDPAAARRAAATARPWAHTPALRRRLDALAAVTASPGPGRGQ